MNGEIIYTRTEDGLALEGLWCTPAAAPSAGQIGVLHCHGFAGNFYANRFVSEIAREVTARGHVFLTVNTRGHDCVAEIHRRAGAETEAAGGYVVVGSAHEDFVDCVPDLRAWLDVLQARGCDRIALCGHSAGAAKVAYYQAVQQDPRVETVVFLAPPDVWGLHEAGFGARRTDDLRLAHQWVDAGQGDRLMPVESSMYPVSARTYLSYLGPSATGGVFNFADPDAPFEIVGRLRQPILAVMGAEDRTVLADAAACLAALKAHAARSPQCETVVIPGASHAFAGHEHAVACAVGGWVEQVWRAPAPS
jgi:pimeloyl-ACP methyl ester carboxylesterase